MPSRPPRGSALTFLVLAALAAAAPGCGAPPPVPTACVDDAGCSADAHCRQGTCVADAPPVASISGPSEASTNTELLLDGSTSADADDALVSYTWSVRMRSSSCPPDLGVSRGRALRALFPCAGTFDVMLVVQDATGIASPPAIAAVTVTDRPGAPPTVSTGPALTVAHRCQGSPPTCSAVAPDGTSSLRLSATGSDPDAGAALRYRWEWDAPSSVGTTDPAAAFVDPDVASPTVSITSTGAALAGVWSFLVTVTDADGLSARAEQAVVVTNQAPAVSGGGPVSTVAVYDAATGRYRATGSLAWSASDPDGDTVKTSWRFASSTADHCTFGPGAGGDGTFELSCADPAELASGAVRTIALQATDTGGATSGTATWTLGVTVAR